MMLFAFSRVKPKAHGALHIARERQTVSSIRSARHKCVRR